MKKKTLTKLLGIIMAAVCVVSTMAVTTALSTSAANTALPTGTHTTAAADEGNTEPTIDKEPGIYPIDADHFLIVNPDHTFRLMHGEPPTHNPWTIA